MSYKVETTESFKKDAKSLIKKYKSLKTELAKLAETLSETPRTGTELGNNVYKIRLAVKSKGKGKAVVCGL
jgi:mRNA-degrading endonuclease RelE of RelBE toxin-antitoxin system